MAEEQTLKSEQVFDGRLLKVYRDEVELPDGRHSVREWIDHPGASAVVPLFPDGTTVLVRQFRYPPRRFFLEVPAGEAGPSRRRSRNRSAARAGGRNRRGVPAR